MTWEGGCFCGAIRYRAAAGPLRVTHCHCRHCRGVSGAPFVTWVEFPAGSLTILQGEPVTFSSRPGVTRGFCGRCGTQITYRNQEAPGIAEITACSLDDPSRVTPRDHVWHDRRVPWIHLNDGLPAHPLQRPKE